MARRYRRRSRSGGLRGLGQTFNLKGRVGNVALGAGLAVGGDLASPFILGAVGDKLPAVVARNVGAALALGFAGFKYYKGAKTQATDIAIGAVLANLHTLAGLTVSKVLPGAGVGLVTANQIGAIVPEQLGGGDIDVLQGMGGPSIDVLQGAGYMTH